MPLQERFSPTSSVVTQEKLPAFVLPFELPPDAECSPHLSLEEFIDYLDTNWQKEGLPPEWEKLEWKKENNKFQTGFMMEKQLDTILDPSAPLSLRIDRTTSDVATFCQEYYSGDIIHPFAYYKEYGPEGTRYKNGRYLKYLPDTAQTEERNGSVVRSLRRIETFFLDQNTPEGAIAVMVSPPGKTGMRQMDGKPLVYTDTMVFLFQKRFETIEGCGISTDMTKPEARELIRKLTKTTLPTDAAEEQYVEALAFLPKPTASLHDIVQQMQTTREEITFHSEHANTKKNVGWDRVHQDLDMLSSIEARMLQRTEDAKPILNDLEYYIATCDFSAPNIRYEIKKAVAATLIRLADAFLWKGARSKELQASHHQERHQATNSGHIFLLSSRGSYGDLVGEMSQLLGCAGGGGSDGGELGTDTLIMSVVERRGLVVNGEMSVGDCPEIKCKCGWRPSSSEAQAMAHGGGPKRCPECGWSPGGASLSLPKGIKQEKDSGRLFVFSLPKPQQEPKTTESFSWVKPQPLPKKNAA